MRTYVYVDGFNLYHRALKNTPHKWLNLKALFTTILDPSHEILAIKYYTALVSGRGDPQRPIRQKSYRRALRCSIPEFTIRYGHFMSHSYSTSSPRWLDRVGRVQGIGVLPVREDRCSPYSMPIRCAKKERPSLLLDRNLF